MKRMLLIGVMLVAGVVARGQGPHKAPKNAGTVKATVAFTGGTTQTLVVDFRNE